jgi:hypothetical protein
MQRKSALQTLENKPAFAALTASDQLTFFSSVNLSIQTAHHAFVPGSKSQEAQAY